MKFWKTIGAEIATYRQTHDTLANEEFMKEALLSDNYTTRLIDGKLTPE